jgi:hypothetical protein
MKIHYVYTVFLLSAISCNNNDSVDEVNSSTDSSDKFFTLLDSQYTNVNFINEVVDEEKFNILTYRNFYNGGGVAIGDINNDSLPDLYFTSNQHQNKLYLNKGDFVFEDITETAGVGGTGVWSTGVTMADVNADGLLDIYVCNSGDVDGAYRENELFINNGDLTFAERGKEFNLNNNGYGTHAAFFDYDLDGDLDCYILNNSFKDPGKIELYKIMREVPHPGGDKLMRNDGGVFSDATAEAGIYSSEIGFGLGVAVSDLNNDHLPDLYISNDFWERDYLYMNRGNGKFSEELIDRVDYCSVSSMGADIADLNHDGNPEIFTTDMLPADHYRLNATMAFDPYHLEDLKYRANYHYQIVQNCLHLNDGNASFQEIGLMADVAATDWSWGALIFDFENDGMNDIFVSNGIMKDIMSMDFRDFIGDNEARNAVIAKTGKQDDREFISYIPSQPLANYAFKNEGNFKFKNVADQFGLSQLSFSNGSAYGDLDNDGDLDLVVNNINSPAFVYRNDTEKKNDNHYLKIKFDGSENNKFGIGAKVVLKANGKIHALQNFNTRGFQSSIEPALIFGLGRTETIEELEVVWPDNRRQILKDVKVNQTLILDYRLASDLETNSQHPVQPTFTEVSKKIIRGDASHRENRVNDFDQEILLPRMLSTEGPRLIVGEVNGDQLEDFILLGAAGDPDKLFIQTLDGKFSFKPNANFVADKGFESTCGALLDYDGDGDLDLMIGSGGNEIKTDRMFFIVRLYKNDGRGNFTADPNASPQLIGNFSTIKADDVDNDGDVDVFLGARVVPGNYGLPPRSYLLINDNGSWVDMAPPALGNVGMVTDGAWTDINADGYKDLIVVGDWMAVTIFPNRKGSIKEGSPIPGSKGWWNRIQPSDLDQDGDIDFVLGNWGLNTKFKASLTRPLTLYVNDFDNNGKSEFIINWYPPLDTISYPFATKPELTSQLPPLRRTVLKYKDYANKTYDSLFSKSVRDSAIPYEANYLETAILWNNGQGFALEPLPFEAQVSPVFAIITDDLDEDGKTDIWLGGNFYALKPQVGRHNSSRGVLLKGINGKFINVPQSQNSLYVRGEVRDATIIKSKNIRRILVARNNERLQVFERNK